MIRPARARDVPGRRPPTAAPPDICPLPPPPLRARPCQSGIDDLVDRAAGDTPLWIAKRCEYVARLLSLADFGDLIAGFLSVPAYPAGYKGPAITYVEFEAMEGAISDVAANATAFAHRAPGFDLVVNAMFDSRAAGARDAAQVWVGDLYSRCAYRAWGAAVVGAPRPAGCRCAPKGLTAACQPAPRCIACWRQQGCRRPPAPHCAASTPLQRLLQQLPIFGCSAAAAGA